MPLSGRGPALIFANNNVYGHSEFGLDLREKARGLFVNNELTMNTINICVQASRPLSPLRPRWGITAAPSALFPPGI